MAHGIRTASGWFRNSAFSASVVIAALLPNAAFAEFPDKPIKMIATAAPGAATDITARTVAEHMSKTLKQQVIVENQGGGGGTIAQATVARAPADGYTLLLTTSVLVAAPALNQNLPFDVEKSFEPIAQIVTFYNMLAAAPAFPPKTLAEFLTYAKANEVSVAGGNIGGQSWIMAKKLDKMAGTKFNYIAYKGTGPAMTDVMGGHVQTVFTDPASMKGLLAEGKVRVIASTAPKRTSGYPNVPTFSEAVPGYEQQGWIGLLAPAGTPKDVVQKLHAAVAAALADPAVRARFVDGDFGIVGSTPEQFAALIKKELVTYGTLIKESGVKFNEKGEPVK